MATASASCAGSTPGVPIPTAATAIHGITDADVAACPPFEAVAGWLAKFLKHCDLCGFNLICFDLPFLLAEFARAEVHFPLGRRAVIDVMKVYHRFEPRDLAAAVRHYLGQEHDNRHRTRADAYATAAVLDRQLARYEELPRSVAELHSCLTEVDVEGWFAGRGAAVLFARGKHHDVALDAVARRGSSHRRWRAEHVLPDARRLIEKALRYGTA